MKFEIAEWVKPFLNDKSLFVLRDKNGSLLNVSYTEEGLK